MQYQQRKCSREVDFCPGWDWGLVPVTSEKSVQLNQYVHKTKGVNHTKTMWFYPFIFIGKDPRKGWRIPLNEIKYNEQRDEETGYGYFGARYMDHELMTMWLSVDPMADKYPSMSPYNYCAWNRPTGGHEHRLIKSNIVNNPVKLIDPDGKEIHLTFYGKSTISIFNSIIEKGLGNQFKASYSKNSDGSYTFSLKTTEGGGDISKLNKYQKAFYEELSDCIKGTDVANIEIVSGLSSVHIWNYRNNQVDIADVQQFDDIGKGLCTKQGKLIHEFREQYQKACLGYRKGEDNEYNSCHQYAIISENHVNGSRRGKETYAQGIVSQQYSNGGHVSTYSYSTQKPLLNPTKNAILKVRKY